MIVTDHHECREALPEAEAVVDPKQPDSSGVGTALAGVGVAFKLVCAMDGDADKMLARYGDLVAVGTVADVMPAARRKPLHHALRSAEDRRGQLPPRLSRAGGGGGRAR